jgi:hypothetical protein
MIASADLRDVSNLMSRAGFTLLTVDVGEVSIGYLGHDFANAQVLERAFFIVTCEFPFSSIWARYGFRV